MSSLCDIESEQSSLECNIAEVKKLLSEITKTKSCLRYKGSTVKSEILTSISRQLESLRTREVWLLEQLELVQSIQEEELCNQAENLNSILGQLNVCLQIIDKVDLKEEAQNNKDLLNVMQVIDDTLSRFEDLKTELSEEEYSVHFNADSEGLRESIQHFGRINLKGMASFAEPGSKSKSLPQAFEDYEDEEHHVLYKTLQPSASVVNFCPPKKSKLRPEDWLFIPTDLGSAPQPLAEPLYPPFQVDVDQWLAVRNLPASQSISQWLRDLGEQGGDLEEDAESYQVISSDTMSLGESSVKTESDCSVKKTCEQEFPYFIMIHNSGADQWLLRCAQDSLMALADDKQSLAKSTVNCFSDVSLDTKQWLKCKQDEDKDDCCSSRCSLNSSPAKTSNAPIDIENLAEELSCHTLTEPRTPNDVIYQYFKQVLESDYKAWLIGDERVPPVSQHISEVCRANEVCLTFDECVSDEKCCRNITEGHCSYDKFKTPVDKNKWPTNNWLKSQTSCSTNKTEIHEEEMPMLSNFKQVREDSIDSWIKSDESQKSGKPSVMSCGWLKDPSNVSNHDSSISSWLLVDRNSSDVKSMRNKRLSQYNQWLSTESDVEKAAVDEVWLSAQVYKKSSSQSPFQSGNDVEKWLLVKSDNRAETVFRKSQFVEENKSGKDEEVPEYKDDVWLSKDSIVFVKENNWFGNDEPDNKVMYPTFMSNTAISDWLM